MKAFQQAISEGNILAAEAALAKLEAEKFHPNMAVIKAQQNTATAAAVDAMYAQMEGQDAGADREEMGWPSEKELEDAFASSFAEKVINEYVNNEDYNPENANDLAGDLLYSDDLTSDKYWFQLRPFEIRVKGEQIFSREGYEDTGLPTVFDPGWDLPVPFEREGLNSVFVIKYQIVILF